MSAAPLILLALVFAGGGKKKKKKKPGFKLGPLVVGTFAPPKAPAVPVIGTLDASYVADFRAAQPTTAANANWCERSGGGCVALPSAVIAPWAAPAALQIELFRTHAQSSVKIWVEMFAPVGDGSAFTERACVRYEFVGAPGSGGFVDRVRTFNPEGLSGGWVAVCATVEGVSDAQGTGGTPPTVREVVGGGWRRMILSVAPPVGGGDVPAVALYRVLANWVA